MTDVRLAPVTMADVPPGRGRWRLTLHNRRWQGQQTPAMTQIGELLEARSRRLELALSTPAILTFSLPGRSASAFAVREMTTEVLAWRYNVDQRADECLFAGVVTSTQDAISEQSHTVSVTCQDYSSMLKRRYLTTPYDTGDAGMEQDYLVGVLLDRAISTRSADLYPFAAYLPLLQQNVDPGGTPRFPGGPNRVRRYDRAAQIFELLELLSNVIGGFDWSVQPTTGADGFDQFKVWYPRRGIERDVPLVYGWNVAALDRYSSSADYANAQLVTGFTETAGEDEGAPVPFSEVWNVAATEAHVGDPGLFQNAYALADTREQASLDQAVAGALASSGTIIPTFHLQLRPGGFDELRGAGVDLGDVVPLVINSGRLSHATAPVADRFTRILAVTLEITDDGTENVSLNTGRPDVTLVDIFTGADRRLAALERRAT